MPLAAWNGKFQGVGNGGYAGTITYTAGSGGLERGMAEALRRDPSRCSFDFKSLACSGEDSPSCLTAAQVETARTLTSPAVHPRSGETIFPGLALGTELGWGTRIGGPAPNPLGADFVKYAVYRNPDWDWRTFDLETAVVQADRIEGIDASADLRAFMRRGGKLLLYHGWADQNFSAQSTIDYHRKVVDTIGSAPQTGDWLRLFLAPGMGHCGGGQGLNTFDMVSALERWVENNQPPALVVASQSINGKLGSDSPVVSLPSSRKVQRDGKSRRSREFSVRDAVTRRLMLL